MVGAAGFAHKPEVALYLPPFALAANALVGVCARILAVVNIAAAQKLVYLAVGGDKLAKRLCLQHRLAHESIVLHAAAVVGESADELRRLLHFRKLSSLTLHAYRAVGQHVYHGVAPDYLKLLFKVLSAVRCGAQIRHRAHAGVAARRRRHAAGFYRLLIRKTRFSQMNVYICETGNNETIMKFGVHVGGKRLTIDSFEAAVGEKL